VIHVDNVVAEAPLCLRQYSMHWDCKTVRREKLTQRIGPMGIDAITCIVGFFVSAIGGGLIFDGVVEALQMHGVTTLH